MKKTLQLAVILALTAGSLSIPANYASQTGADQLTLQRLENEVEHAKTIDNNLMSRVAEFVKHQPNDARAHFLLAEVYQRSGFDDLADEEYKRSDQIAPMQAAVLLDLFTAKLAQEDYASASKYFNYLESRYPGDASVIFMRGAFSAENNKRLADAMFKLAVERAQPGDGIRTAVSAFSLHWNRPAESLKLAMEDLTKRPNNFQTVMMVGKSLVGLHRYQEAAPYLKRAYETKPTDTNLAEVYGNALVNLDNRQEAVEPLLIGLGMQTNYEKMQHLKGTVLTLLRSMPISEFLCSLKTADEKLDKTVYQARLHLAMGDVFDRNGQVKLAIEEYKRGVELNPQAARGYYRLAVDMNASGDYYHAMKYFRQAYDANHSDKQVSLNYARLVVRLNNRENDLAWRAKDCMRDWLHRTQ